MKTGKIVTFGEIMMRLNPVGYTRFVRSNLMEISYAGGEANVAVSLANYGLDSSFVSKLPTNELGQSAINSMRQFGVDTSSVIRGEERLGLYFVEKGASQRSSKVVYDRKNSAFSQSSEKDFDWDVIFDDASWFHFTGITPALGGELPEICLKACEIARKKNITVSCDVNYRNKLWSKANAREIMSNLMNFVDVCIINEEDANDVFGISAKNSDVAKGTLNHKGYIEVAQEIVNRFGCKYVGITLRGSISASVNEWSGLLFDGEKAYFGPKFTIQLVDRVGGGDSFGGGLIYSLINKKPLQDAIDFAVSASCLKQTMEQDFNLVSVEEVERLVGGNTSGRVVR